MWVILAAAEQCSQRRYLTPQPLQNYQIVPSTDRQVHNWNGAILNKDVDQVFAHARQIQPSLQAMLRIQDLSRLDSYNSSRSLCLAGSLAWARSWGHEILLRFFRLYFISQMAQPGSISGMRITRQRRQLFPQHCMARNASPL